MIGAAPLLPPRLTRDVRKRSVIAWVGVHVSLALSMSMGSASVPALAEAASSFSPITSAGVVLLVPVLVLLDIRVCRERTFLANLGVRRAWIWQTALLPALLLETLWQLLTMSL